VRVAVFSTKNYDRVFLETANATYGHELVFFEPRLTEATTALAAQFPITAFEHGHGAMHEVSAERVAQR
jgi:hypothetical protein